MTLCIMGAGAFGSAIALSIAHSSEKVILWCRSQEFAEELDKTRKNKRLLVKAYFPKNIQITCDIHNVMRKSSTLIICIPTQEINGFFSKYHSIIPIHYFKEYNNK